MLVGLDGDVEVAVRGNTLVISSARQPRAGWAEAFRAMAQHGDDRAPSGHSPHQRSRSIKS